jgi:hypothetical protein
MFDIDTLYTIRMSLESSIRWYKNKREYLIAASKDGLDIAEDLGKTEKELKNTEKALNEVMCFF